MIKIFHGNETKISACMVKEFEKSATWPNSKGISRDLMEQMLREEELIHSIHVKEANLSGITNFKRAFLFEMPIEQIEKALVSRKCLLQLEP